MTELTREQREAIERQAVRADEFGDYAAGTTLRSILAAHPTEQAGADAEDAARYRGLYDALMCGDIPMSESRITLRTVGVPPTREEFDAAINAAMVRARTGGKA